jgi:hypothetical protein
MGKKRESQTSTSAVVDRSPRDPVGLRFIECDAGWINFTVDALVVSSDVIAATHLEDPFPNMMRWLEAIADGADCASWAIPQEGTSARLIFVAEHSGWLGGGSDRLIHIDEGSELYGFATVAVDRRALVQEFYRTFRQFVGGVRYIPLQWEPPPLPEGRTLDDLSEEEEPSYYGYDGDNLRALVSPKLEAYLARREKAPDE